MMTTHPLPARVPIVRLEATPAAAIEQYRDKQGTPRGYQFPIICVLDDKAGTRVKADWQAYQLDAAVKELAAMPLDVLPGQMTYDPVTGDIYVHYV
jgi:hypothetical protein